MRGLRQAPSPGAPPAQQCLWVSLPHLCGSVSRRVLRRLHLSLGKISISFSRGIFPTQGWRVSCMAGRFFTTWAVREAPGEISWEHSSLGSGEPVCDCWLFHNVALYTWIFFFKKAYICIHILEGSGFRKETRVVKVTHFTRVFALTKEPQRTRPWPLAGKTP